MQPSQHFFWEKPLLTGNVFVNGPSQKATLGRVTRSSERRTSERQRARPSEQDQSPAQRSFLAMCPFTNTFSVLLVPISL